MERLLKKEENNQKSYAILLLSKTQSIKMQSMDVRCPLLVFHVVIWLEHCQNQPTEKDKEYVSAYCPLHIIV